MGIRSQFLIVDGLDKLNISAASYDHYRIQDRIQGRQGRQEIQQLTSINSSLFTEKTLTL